MQLELRPWRGLLFGVNLTVVLSHTQLYHQSQHEGVLQVPEHLIIHEHGGQDKFKYTVIEAILENTVVEVGPAKAFIVGCN